MDIVVETYTFLEKLSTKITKYLALPTDVFLMGPQTPKYTISNGFVVSMSASLPNFASYCLSFVHASQTNVEVGQEVLHRFMSLAML